jgi:hypothetical protein
MRKLKELSISNTTRRSWINFQFPIGMKRLTARDTFISKTGSYEGFSEQCIPEVLEQVPSHQDKAPMGETR